MEREEMRDIHCLEALLKEKDRQLQCKINDLERIQAEINRIRPLLYEGQMLFKKERERVEELEIERDNAQKMIELLKKIVDNHQQEKIGIKIDYDVVKREKETLLKQIQDVEIENMALKSKIQQLEKKITHNETFRETIGFTLHQLETSNIMKICQDLQSEVLKLEKEQEYLRQSIKSTISFKNRLLMAAGICTDYKQQNQNEIIQESANHPDGISVEKVRNSFQIESIVKLPESDQVIEFNSDSEENLDRQMEVVLEEVENI